RASPCRFARRRRRRTSGRCGTRSDVRRSCCAASIPTCCQRRRRARGASAARARAWRKYRVSATRRCCCRATRSISSPISCDRPYNRRAPTHRPHFGASAAFMSLALRLPPFAERPAHPPEIRPSRIAHWLTEASTREPGFAARIMGDALSATNRVGMSHARRLALTEQYWKTAALLWPRIEHRFIRASHPLQADDLEAAKAALTLATELATAYKRL